MIPLIAWTLIAFYFGRTYLSTRMTTTLLATVAAYIFLPGHLYLLCPAVAYTSQTASLLSVFTPRRILTLALVLFVLRWTGALAGHMPPVDTDLEILLDAVTHPSEIVIDPFVDAFYEGLIEIDFYEGLENDKQELAALWPIMTKWLRSPITVYRSAVEGQQRMKARIIALFWVPLGFMLRAMEKFLIRSMPFVLAAVLAVALWLRSRPEDTDKSHRETLKAENKILIRAIKMQIAEIKATDAEVCAVHARCEQLLASIWSNVFCPGARHHVQVLEMENIPQSLAPREPSVVKDFMFQLRHRLGVRPGLNMPTADEVESYDPAKKHTALQTVHNDNRLVLDALEAEHHSLLGLQPCLEELELMILDDAAHGHPYGRRGFLAWTSIVSEPDRRRYAEYRDLKNLDPTAPYLATFQRYELYLASGQPRRGTPSTYATNVNEEPPSPVVSVSTDCSSPVSTTTRFSETIETRWLGMTRSFCNTGQRGQSIYNSGSRLVPRIIPSRRFKKNQKCITFDDADGPIEPEEHNTRQQRPAPQDDTDVDAVAIRTQDPEQLHEASQDSEQAPPAGPADAEEESGTDTEVPQLPACDTSRGVQKAVEQTPSQRPLSGTYKLDSESDSLDSDSSDSENQGSDSPESDSPRLLPAGDRTDRASAEDDLFGDAMAAFAGLRLEDLPPLPPSPEIPDAPLPPLPPFPTPSPPRRKTKTKTVSWAEQLESYAEPVQETAPEPEQDTSADVAALYAIIAQDVHPGIWSRRYLPRRPVSKAKYSRTDISQRFRRKVHKTPRRVRGGRRVKKEPTPTIDPTVVAVAAPAAVVAPVAAPVEEVVEPSESKDEGTLVDAPAQPIVQPTSQPAAQLAARPAPHPAAQPAAQTIVQPTSQPAAQPAAQPAIASQPAVVAQPAVIAPVSAPASTTVADAAKPKSDTPVTTAPSAFVFQAGASTGESAEPAAGPSDAASEASLDDEFREDFKEIFGVSPDFSDDEDRIAHEAEAQFTFDFSLPTLTTAAAPSYLDAQDDEDDEEDAQAPAISHAPQLPAPNPVPAPSNRSTGKAAAPKQSVQDSASSSSAPLPWAKAAQTPSSAKTQDAVAQKAADQDSDFSFNSPMAAPKPAPKPKAAPAPKTMPPLYLPEHPLPMPPPLPLPADPAPTAPVPPAPAPPAPARAAPAPTTAPQATPSSTTPSDSQAPKPPAAVESTVPPATLQTQLQLPPASAFTFSFNPPAAPQTQISSTSAFTFNFDRPTAPQTQTPSTSAFTFNLDLPTANPFASQSTVPAAQSAAPAVQSTLPAALQSDQVDQSEEDSITDLLYAGFPGDNLPLLPAAAESQDQQDETTPAAAAAPDDEFESVEELLRQLGISNETFDNTLQELGLANDGNAEADNAGADDNAADTVDDGVPDASMLDRDFTDPNLYPLNYFDAPDPLAGTDPFDVFNTGTSDQNNDDFDFGLYDYDVPEFGDSAAYTGASTFVDNTGGNDNGDDAAVVAGAAADSSTQPAVSFGDLLDDAFGDIDADFNAVMDPMLLGVDATVDNTGGHDTGDAAAVSADAAGAAADSTAQPSMADFNDLLAATLQDINAGANTMIDPRLLGLGANTVVDNTGGHAMGDAAAVDAGTVTFGGIDADPNAVTDPSLLDIDATIDNIFQGTDLTAQGADLTVQGTGLTAQDTDLTAAAGSDIQAETDLFAEGDFDAEGVAQFQSAFGLGGDGGDELDSFFDQGDDADGQPQPTGATEAATGDGPAESSASDSASEIQ